MDKYTRRITPRTNIHMLEIHITEHCNLNCQSCTHFSPLAEPEFTDIYQFEKDIKRLSKLTKNINYINILGGEPLLNPDCIKYLKITRKYFPKTIIRLITNGILLPSQSDDFYKDLNKNNICLSPTKYEQLNINYDNIIKKCEEFKVKFEFYGIENIKTSYKLSLDLTGSQDITNNFIQCFLANFCFQLVKGKIYTCCIAAYIRHFNKYFNKNLEISDFDGIDIYKAKNIQEILNFLAKPIPFCRYCNITKREFYSPWKISTKNIEEWVEQ